MRKILFVIFSVCLILSTLGCVSLLNQNKKNFGDEDCSFPPYTYGGTITSVGMLGVVVVEIPKNPLVIVGGAMLLVDFPFTVALDTLILPISVGRDISACRQQRKKETLQTDDQDVLQIGQGYRLDYLRKTAYYENAD